MTTLLRGDARTLPLRDATVDLVVTSPPYFGLRSYSDNGEHYTGQIGSEPTPTEFLDALIACTAEMMRVLKPSGSIWVNLGDKYAAAPQGPVAESSTLNGRKPLRAQRGPSLAYGTARQKSLLLLPHRYAIRCMDDLGLIVRQDQVWAKPNPLPESVVDRTRRSHEYFFHLVKSPRYFSAVDEIRTPLSAKSLTHRGGGQSWGNERNPDNNWGDAQVRRPDPRGALPGSVWEIATQPLKVPAELGVDHFAAFPMEWPRRIVQGWSPREVCTGCGEGRRPVADRTPMLWCESPTASGRNAPGTTRRSASGTQLAPATTTITGYACACPDTTAPSTPGVVLDPFSGTGTTALVATMLERRGIGVDMSADYCRLARWRCSDPKERARAFGLSADTVSAITPQIPGQMDMFTTEGVPA